MCRWIAYRGETVSLAAARAVMQILQREQVSEHLARIGSAVREAFREACAKHGLVGDMLGPPQRLTFSFQETAGLDAQRLRLLFVREVAREGVLTTGTLLPSFAHDERAVERTTEAMTAALERVAAATRSAQAALAAYPDFWRWR